MPIGELLHRRPDQRESSPVKNPELLVGKANELWRLIAPWREPDIKWKGKVSYGLTTSTSFMAKEMVPPIPQSPELELFWSILEPCLLSKNSRRDTFRLMLGINPAWYNYPEKNTSVFREGSFSFAIRILAPSWINPLVSVMDILERPGRKGILGFGTTNYDISVKKEKEPLSGTYQEVKPIRHSDYYDARVDTFANGSLPKSVRWQKYFVSEVIDMFIAMAKDVRPEQSAQKDKHWQRVLARTAAAQSSLKQK